MQRPDDHAADPTSGASISPSAGAEDASAPSRSRRSTRRDVIKAGTKLAFVAPMVLTFSAREALAAGSNHSCYPAGHACPGAEPCCNGLTCNDGTCGDPCQAVGELCFVPSDCCSGNCQLGTCQ